MRIDEVNNAGFGGETTGTIEHEGSGGVVTYLSVTENRVEVELSCTGSGQFDLDLDLRDGEFVGFEGFTLDLGRVGPADVWGSTGPGGVAVSCR